MKNDLRTPKLGMVVALCVALAALWLVALYGTYEDSKREKYDVRVRPGAVTYGTHSTATIPMTSVATRRSAVPMISGGAVRSYAHYGHATMPSAASGSSYRVHTLSSATVHTIGSGGGGGGGMSSGSSSSSRGISYSGVSVSMPTLAMATPTYSTGRSTTSTIATQTQEVKNAQRRVGRIRKAAPVDDGEAGDRVEDDEVAGKWWYWNEDEGWVTESEDIPYGTKWNNSGTWYTWNGSEWVADSGGDVSDPTNTPVGDAPWHWMLLLMAVYGGAKVWKSKKQRI